MTSSRRSNPDRRRRGTFIVVAGPDGAGKTTVATAIAEVVGGAHYYWRPGLLPMPRRLLGRSVAPWNNDNPHERLMDNSVKGLLRSVYYGLDFLLGYRLKLRRQLRDGRDVVVERWVFDVPIDPRRYGLRGARLLSAVGRLLPRCDLLAVLVAPPAAIVDRKPELEPEEIARQYAAWHRLSHGYRRRVEVDTTSGVERAVDELLQAAARA